jgi:invasion protein IalB
MHLTSGSADFRLPILCLLLLLALGGPANAQQPGDNKSFQSAAPRGERMARAVKFGDWQKLCFKPPGMNMACRTTISGTWETGQSAVRADLIEREGEGAARLQLFLPVGLYLPAGLKLTIDQGSTYRVPYVWCLTNACIAAEVADPKLVQEMETGKTLVLEAVDSNLLTVSTMIPVDRFGAVRKGSPTRVFEQGIDE